MAALGILSGPGAFAFAKCFCKGRIFLGKSKYVMVVLGFLFFRLQSRQFHAMDIVLPGKCSEGCVFGCHCRLGLPVGSLWLVGLVFLLRCLGGVLVYFDFSL